MSDEEKKAIKELTEIKELFEEDLKENYEATAILDQIDLESLVIVLNLVEKQSKEIEELKEDRKEYAEEYIHNNPWLYKQLNENYILRIESEQKEKEAYNFGYRNGCNDTSKFNDKTFIRIDKIKAKIEELERQEKEEPDAFLCKKVLQSLLEKE